MTSAHCASLLTAAAGSTCAPWGLRARVVRAWVCALVCGGILLGAHTVTFAQRLCDAYKGLPLATAAAAGSSSLRGSASSAPAAAAAAVGPPPGMVALPGGRFMMGSDRFYREERPLREAQVGPFAILRHEVTNAQFAAFVAATGYKTVAERPLDAKQFPKLQPQERLPGSLVFRQPAQVRDMVDISQWWAWTPGASWRAPTGPGSTVKGRDNHPVVHIAFEDALAYARWTGQDLPTEAEWEYAARGGLDGADYTWGTDKARRDADGKPLANHWQGLFPVKDLKEDGHAGAAPVGCFEPNGFGLYDMAGNVWELTRDDYADARGPYAGMKVAKGGSFLCADNFCGRYRPAARTPHGADTGMQHVGFRTVWRGVTAAPKLSPKP
jgi:formylglycine-generating enzyme required for sulfatase activity